MKLQDTNLQVSEKKLFHMSSFMYFAFIFSECITVPSSEEALKVCEHNFFQRKVITCNLPVQSRFIEVNYLHVEYGIWRSLEYSFCQIKSNCSFLAIESFLFCVLTCTFFIKTLCFIIIVLHQGSNKNFGVHNKSGNKQ